MKLLFTSLTLVAAFAVTHPLSAQKKDQGGTYTDPTHVDEDYAFQGEYSGEIDGEKIGYQVIALGDGNFEAVQCNGGLPGEGWDKEQPRVRVKGKRDGEKAVFQSEEGRGVIEKNKAKIFGADGELLATLDKVARQSPTLGAKPPEGAVVLFDGSNADAFKNGKMSEDGLLMQGSTSKQEFGSHRLHLEFRLPYKPKARGQGRGNSGIYMQGRFETQMLDSFGLTGEMNECGGIYSIAKPSENMCYPPLTWQTYDIDFTAAEFDADGKKTKHARMTVKHNGVVIHDDQELDHATTASPKKDVPGPGPVYLQNHGNPVVYRNIWLVEKK